MNWDPLANSATISLLSHCRIPLPTYWGNSGWPHTPTDGTNLIFEQTFAPIRSLRLGLPLYRMSSNRYSMSAFKETMQTFVGLMNEQPDCAQSILPFERLTINLLFTPEDAPDYALNPVRHSSRQWEAEIKWILEPFSRFCGSQLRNVSFLVDGARELIHATSKFGKF
jgi:hypothetical protein